MKYQFLLFVFLCFSFKSYSQIGFQERIVIDQTHITSKPTSIYSTDIDGDGDLDILSSLRGNNRIVWYENLDSKGYLSQQKIINAEVDGLNFAYPMDIDGDGDIDIVSASETDNKIAWYENTDGKGNFGLQQIIMNQERVLFVYGTDVDNDGDNDVVFSSKSEIAWSENIDGKGNFNTKKIISAVGQDFTFFSLADMDMDGNIDVLATLDYSHEVIWFKNLDGKGDFGDYINIARGATHAVGRDIDGDGDMDVIATGSNDVFWYDNMDGMGTFSKKVIDSNFATDVIVYVQDIDGDSDLDIIAASSGIGGKITWFENTDGEGSFTLKESINNNPKKAHWIHVGDLDGDNDIDILRASYEDNELIWYENTDGMGSFGPDKMISRYVNLPITFSVADFDGDGDKDIVSGSDNERIDWYENLDGKGTYGLQKSITSGLQSVYFVYGTDIDNDGDNDIIGIISNYPDNRIVWFENVDGKGSFSAEKMIEPITKSIKAAVADIDGDNDMDIVAFSDTDKIVWYENMDGNASFSTKKIIIQNLSRPSTIHLADLDNDGDIDISFGNSNLRGDGFHWVANLDGKGSFGSSKRISTYGSYARDITSVDIDNDGDLDIIGCSDRMDLWENIDGKGNFAFKNTFELFSSVQQSIAVDIDGDGDKDVVRDGLFWYENLDGKGGDFSDPITILPFGVHIIDSADIDNDGDFDLVFADGTQKISWIENLGALTNKINGTVLLDLNDNGCDPMDQSFTNTMIISESTTNSFATIIDVNGAFSIPTNEGDFKTSIPTIPNYFKAVPAFTNTKFNSQGNTDTVSFCIDTIATVNDLAVIIHPTWAARPGFPTNQALTYKNNGTTQLSGTIDFKYDETKLNKISTSQNIISETNNTIRFEFSNLQPLKSHTIYLNFNVLVPPIVNGGDFLSFESTINSQTDDATPEDNIAKYNQRVVNSYDPNDITVLEGDKVSIEKSGDYLNYLIRFQNTGTASAIKIKIDHELDANLDWKTFSLISASHPNTTTITNGTDVEFLFENINLPDNTSNEAESHGYITFKIKPKSDITVGDLITGKASIFFDFNTPIITNTVNTEITSTLSNLDFETTSVNIFPVPTKDIIYIKSSRNTDVKRIALYSINGSVLIEQNQGFDSIDISSLSKGIYFLKIGCDRGELTKKIIKY